MLFEILRNLRSERGRVAINNGSNSLRPNCFVLRVVTAAHAVTVLAVLAASETLTVQF